MTEQATQTAEEILAGVGVTPNERQGQDTDRPTRRLVLTPASSITPEPVIWAWEPATHGGRIPAGALTLAAGREGTGKSSFGIWLAAELTRGTLPGSFYGQPRAVFYCAVEDSWSRTLVPRLMATGANLDLVYRLDVQTDELGTTMISLPADCRMVEDAVREYAAAAVILDPLMSTLGSGTDAHRTQDVRMALEPVVRMAERTACLTLGIAHFSKAAGTDAAQLVSGSGAFKDLARAILAFACDRETDEQVMSQVKNSLGRLDLPSLGYRIDSADVPTPTGTANVGRFTFTGETDRSVADVLGTTTISEEDRSERKDAADWLNGYLTDADGSAEAAEIKSAARAAGISARTLDRARKDQKVVTKRDGFGKGAVYRWSIEPPCSPHVSHVRQLPSPGKHGVHGGEHGKDGSSEPQPAPERASHSVTEPLAQPPLRLVDPDPGDRGSCPLRSCDWSALDRQHGRRCDDCPGLAAVPEGEPAWATPASPPR